MADLGCLSWNSLPEHIILKILSYLSLQERYYATLTCKSWYVCFSMPQLWKKNSFRFYVPNQRRFLKCVELYGHFLQYLYIELDQEVRGNRENACAVLESLAETCHRNLSSISIKFTGENPLFYAGQEFVKALKVLFGPVNNNIRPLTHITTVDLSGLTIQFDDGLMSILSKNNFNLEKLNIQNSVIVCKVSPNGLLNLIKSCFKLRDLRVYHCSMSEAILLELSTEQRVAIEHLNIVCRREDKFIVDLPSPAWVSLVKKSPHLHVTLGFDHTCPLDRVSVLMKPEIPVRELLFETFTDIYNEVNLAVDFYGNSLQKLVLQTQNSDDLRHALLNLALHCHELKTLWVYCVLDKDVVDKILDTFPAMQKRKSYILKCQMETEPWLPGFLDE